jgi:hypothetical protein
MHVCVCVCAGLMHKFMSLLHDSDAAMDRDVMACAVQALARQVARRRDVRSGKLLAKFHNFLRNIGLVTFINSCLFSLSKYRSCL